MANNTAIAILDATLSNLTAKRDEVLTQLNLIINQNGVNIKLSDVISYTADLFIKLANIDSAIENVKFIIESNKQQNEDLIKLQSALMEFQKIKKQEKNDGDNT